MKYKFELINTSSNLRKFTKEFDMSASSKIKDIKLEFIGPIIETYGYDKIRFLHNGKILNDNSSLLNIKTNNSIIIFSMIPQYKHILLQLFDDSSNLVGGSSESKLPLDLDLDLETMSDDIPEVDEEEPKFEKKTLDEIMKISNKTLNMFNE